jgi:hypothetical protein
MLVENERSTTTGQEISSSAPNNACCLATAPEILLEEIFTPHPHPSYDNDYDLVVTAIQNPTTAPPSFYIGNKARTPCCVSFNKFVIMHPHIHLNEYSENEVKMTWYNSTDIADILEDCEQTIKAMVSRTCGDKDIEYCPRGLEYGTASGAQLRQTNRFNAWDAVLDEQDRQYQEGADNTERLGHAVYSICAIGSVQAAHLMALCDERLIRDGVPQEMACCFSSKAHTALVVVPIVGASRLTRNPSHPREALPA